MNLIYLKIIQIALSIVQTVHQYKVDLNVILAEEIEF